MAIENNMNYGFARHPGTILGRELDARGMTHAELALRAGTSEKNISQIINGVAPISPEMAIKLEYALGTPAHVWNSLMMNYQEALLRDKARELTKIEEEHAAKFDYSKIREIYPELPDAHKKVDRTDALRRMFGVSSLASIFDTDSSSYLKFAARSNASATGKVPDKYALISWLRVGEIKASKYSCAQFDARKLRKALPEIKVAINNMGISEAWKRIRRLLSECGVKLVAIPYLTKTYVNGAVRWISDNPVIIMSNKNAYADIFWFSLMHEICHIIKHGKKYACVTFDSTIKCFERRKEEDEADEFAAEFFIPEKDYTQFVQGFRRGDIPAIYQFAEKEKVPYYIVAGRMCRMKDGVEYSDAIATQRPKVKIQIT